MGGQAIIWSYTDPDRAPIAVETRHSANIFGVAFLPCTGDKEIVTGAMDKEVRLLTLDALPNSRLPQGEARSVPVRRPDANHMVVVTPDRPRVFRCHTGRVKVRLKTQLVSRHFEPCCKCIRFISLVFFLYEMERKGSKSQVRFNSVFPDALCVLSKTSHSFFLN